MIRTKFFKLIFGIFLLFIGFGFTGCENMVDSRYDYFQLRLVERGENDTTATYKVMINLVDYYLPSSSFACRFYFSDDTNTYGPVTKWLNYTGGSTMKNAKWTITLNAEDIPCGGEWTATKVGAVIEVYKSGNVLGLKDWHSNDVECHLHHE